jgi:hypothetical protein
VSTRAIYSFSGFSGSLVHHYYLHHDGYPAGAACLFMEVLSETIGPSGFLTTFLNTHPQPQPIRGTEYPEDVEYHYLILLVDGNNPRLDVQCWRRLPGGSRWHCRYGPLPLTGFFQQVLPGGAA